MIENSIDNVTNLTEDLTEDLTKKFPDTNYSDEDAKIVICGIIKEIYGNNLANNQPENITPDVIDIVTDAVNRIKSATYPLLGTHVVYSFIYTAPGSIFEVLFGLWADMVANGSHEDTQDVLQTYKDWIGAIRKNRIYKASISSAAVATRTGLELALMGI